jgi:hypothetical protein
MPCYEFVSVDIKDRYEVNCGTSEEDIMDTLPNPININATLIEYEVETLRLSQECSEDKSQVTIFGNVKKMGSISESVTVGFEGGLVGVTNDGKEHRFESVSEVVYKEGEFEITIPNLDKGSEYWFNAFIEWDETKRENQKPCSGRKTEKSKYFRTLRCGEQIKCDEFIEEEGERHYRISNAYLKWKLIDDDDFELHGDKNFDLSDGRWDSDSYPVSKESGKFLHIHGSAISSHNGDVASIYCIAREIGDESSLPDWERVLRIEGAWNVDAWTGYDHDGSEYEWILDVTSGGSGGKIGEIIS